MNAVEIEEAVSTLAEAPFDAVNFPYAFLEAFGNKDTTLKRLRTGDSNQSDLPGGVLQRNNIHLKVCPAGTVTTTLTSLRESPATSRQKAKFILATDGITFKAENLVDGETVACAYPDFHDHFGFFLPLAGITTVKQIRENAFDIKATSRLNRLYIELLRDNPEWATAARREDLNHFMARLIFCFFAEDTAIFGSNAQFTDTLAQMSARDSSDTHLVLSELFRAMNTKPAEREVAGIKNWANGFPYVNGGLFGNTGAPKVAGSDVPRFSKIARSYLLHVGNLDWTKINPDIFGSMIQAVADEEERGALGMHYTSVPNILKVLNPLFLDDLRAKLAEAGDGKTPGSARKLLALRQRLTRIRVFDPACGSGNFLVIAYKELRAIEAEINRLRGEADRPTDIPLTNFRGIELRNFSAEIARLALIIAEYQCDVAYRGHRLALAEFLPLQATNWITCGNALRIDWLSVCPPTGKSVKLTSDDLFETPLDQAEIDFKNEGGETYICGNPPYLGSRWRDPFQQKDLADLFSQRTPCFKDLDYVAAWYLKASEYIKTVNNSGCAFVATKSICQGEQVAMLWPLIFEDGLTISFAYRPFHWSNLASHNAGVTVVIVGLTQKNSSPKTIYDEEEKRVVENIGPYLIATENVIVGKLAKPMNGLPRMDYGNKPTDGGNLIFDDVERSRLIASNPDSAIFIKNYAGSSEFINCTRRFCIWVEQESKKDAYAIPDFERRFEAIRQLRLASKGSQANANASTPYRFVFTPHKTGKALIVPRVSSERRPYLPAGLVDDKTIISDRAAVVYNPETWALAIIVSRLHLVWIATVCVRMRMDFSYSNTLGWNTFPVPKLTEANKADLTRCAEDILLAREAHFPATIADLYDPESMPDNLRVAHERNDETLERIYLGRRFKNDTERLEKLFSLYTEMTAKQGVVPKKPITRKTKATPA
jgi:hypothetical protein